MTGLSHRMRQLTASPLLPAAALGLAALIAPAWVALPKLFLWNASASVPIGLYLVEPPTRLRVGDLAVADLPSDARDLAARRHYLPADVRLIKPIAATARTMVCRTADTIMVDDNVLGTARPTDTLHRIMPRWSGCRQLTPQQIFLMNPAVPDSFDGRYFGPISLSLIHGRAIPLITFRTARPQA